ncbi:MAG TPA: zf-HC2 domain-containing protein, partial [Acidimicrobiales bacterium]|nr:zf-HC2 domain-containing protein [Acidimicrobiales bacterium]
MTSTPLPPDDELVSAYLDGEASDDERARVEGDPVLVARVAELRAAAAAVAAPVDPLDEVTRRRLIDASLAAGAPVAAAGSVAPPAAPVVELANRRRRPAAWVVA